MHSHVCSKYVPRPQEVSTAAKPKWGIWNLTTISTRYYLPYSNCSSGLDVQILLTAEREPTRSVTEQTVSFSTIPYYANTVVQYLGCQAENVFNLQIGKEYSCIHATLSIMRYYVRDIVYAVMGWNIGVRHWVCDIRVQYSGWDPGYKQATIAVLSSSPTSTSLFFTHDDVHETHPHPFSCCFFPGHFSGEASGLEARASSSTPFPTGAFFFFFFPSICVHLGAQYYPIWKISRLNQVRYT